MLSNAPASGLDLLTRMATTAAAHAAVRLGGAIRLAGCEKFELAAMGIEDDLTLESWTVDAGRRQMVISVFATAPQANGGRRMTASGRFTFIISDIASGTASDSVPGAPSGIAAKAGKA